jgi:hypothetical protein
VVAVVAAVVAAGDIAALVSVVFGMMPARVAVAVVAAGCSGGC